MFSGSVWPDSHSDYVIKLVANQTTRQNRHIFGQWRVLKHRNVYKDGNIPVECCRPDSRHENSDLILYSEGRAVYLTVLCYPSSSPGCTRWALNKQTTFSASSLSQRLVFISYDLAIVYADSTCCLH